MKFKFALPWWPALMLAVAGSAQAQLAPFSIAVTESLTHQSNVFRARSGSEVPDWYSTTGLRGDLDQAIGRQRAKAFAEFNVLRYQDITSLNNNAYKLGAELDWTTIENLSGSVGADNSSRLYQYGIEGVTPSTGRNIETTKHVFANAKWGGVAHWTLLGGVDAVQRDYSDPLFVANEVRQVSADLGAKYQVNPDLSFTGGLHQTEGKFPSYSSTGGSDRFSLSTVNLSTNWQASAASNFDVTLGYTTENHTLQNDRSFMSGAVRWNWTPPLRIKATVGLRRDSNTNSALGSTGPSLLSQSLNTTGDASLTWEATSKIGVVLAYQNAQSKFNGVVVAGSPVVGSEATQVLSLGASYQYSNAISLGCSAAREKRTVDQQIAAVVPGYGVTTLTCSGQIKFR